MEVLRHEKSPLNRMDLARASSAVVSVHVFHRMLYAVITTHLSNHNFRVCLIQPQKYVPYDLVRLRIAALILLTRYQFLRLRL